MSSSDRRSQLFAIRLSLAVGLLMLAGKWWAYLITGSSAILSDAAESVIHILAVGFAAFSLWLSYRQADRNHPYGHEKIVFFSAGVEGFLIIVAALFIVIESVRKWVGGIELQNLDSGTWVVFAASMVNLALGLFLVWRGKRSDSLILTANGKHVLTDSWTSFGVVVGLLLTLRTGWLPFDPLVAIAVALNIVWTGGKLLRRSIGGLMDEADPKTEAEIRTILENETSHRGLKYHALRQRSSGSTVWIDYHLTFPPGITLEQAHHDATEIERVLSTSLPFATRVTSHLEPRKGHRKEHGEILEHETSAGVSAPPEEHQPPDRKGRQRIY
jgi:cation diffusion facilitator family transporter